VTLNNQVGKNVALERAYEQKLRLPQEQGWYKKWPSTTSSLIVRTHSMKKYVLKNMHNYTYKATFKSHYNRSINITSLKLILQTEPLMPSTQEILCHKMPS
jgi:hypothetical protein